MNADSRVLVYNFRTLDGGCESTAVAGFKATRQDILHVHGGDPIPGTEESVPLDALDSQRRYRRLPTGWGELS